MGQLIIFRLILAIITLLVVSIAVFGLSHSTGSPVYLLLPLEATQEQRDNATKRLGLDKPLPVQYWKFLKGAITLDFGDSIRTKQPAMDMVKQRFGNSIQLASAAVGFGILISIPLGILAAVNRNGILDRLAMTVALIGQSIPAFFSGILAIYVFSEYFDFLPVQGAGGWKHYVLPAITLGWILAAGMTRLLRSSMLEVLDSEFVKLARAKGLPERTVVVKHAFRNALIPLITFIAYTWGIIIGAAIATEVVFAWPGLGRLAYESVLWRDFPLLQAVVLVWASLIIGVNLLADLIYGVIDPRIRTGT